MTARTHDVVAFATLLTAASFFPPERMNIPTFFTCLIGNIVGALIPDMDQATNRLWDLLPAGNIFGKFLRKIMIQHRTISHSILGIFLLFQILVRVMPVLFNEKYVFVEYVVYAIMLGVISHLLADALTREGIPLFFPFRLKVGFPPFAFLRMTTGKFAENFLVFPGVTGYILWLVYFKREIFLSIVRLIKY